MEKICDWLEGRLDNEAAAQIAERVEQDPVFAAHLRWLRHLLEYRPGLRLAEPPPDLRPRLERLFDAPGPRLGAITRYCAELMSDSWSRSPAAGMRAATHGGEARHLVFSCSLLDVSITLRKRLDQDCIDLNGRILAPEVLDVSLCSIELRCGDGRTRLAEADETGEFIFYCLPEGKCRMKVQGPGFEIDTPEVDIT